MAYQQKQIQARAVQHGDWLAIRHPAKLAVQFQVIRWFPTHECLTPAVLVTAELKPATLGQVGHQGAQFAGRPLEEIK